MGKHNLRASTLSGVFIFLFIFAIKAEAFNFYPVNIHKNNDYFQKQLQKLCDMSTKMHWGFWRMPIPRICKTKNTKPPTLEFYAEPTSITKGGNATLSWASDNTLSCEASGGWRGEKRLSGEKEISPKRTKTYTLTCDGIWESVEKSVTIKVLSAIIPSDETDDSDNPPQVTDVCPNLLDNQTTIPDGYHDENGQCVANQTASHVIISEVYPAPASPYGSGTANEWFELYNGTSNFIDLTGWTIWDTATSSHDTFPSGTTIAANGFLFVTASSSTTSLWAIPTNTAIFVLPNTIGSNGLGNSGDALIIKDSAGTIVDAMSYGSDKTIFDLSSLGTQVGHSFSRKSPITNANTAADWEDLATSTPGSF
jgi:hypothetical protein